MIRLMAFEGQKSDRKLAFMTLSITKERERGRSTDFDQFFSDEQRNFILCISQLRIDNPVEYFNPN